MAGAMFTRQQARTFMRAAQVSAIVLGAGAAALWALEVPALENVQPMAVSGVEAPPVALPPRETRRAVDPETVAFIGENLDRAGGVRRSPAPSAQQEITAPPTGSHWRYLGSIMEPGRRVALVSIDGRQRLLAAGRSVGQSALVAVEEDSITIDDNGRQRTIRLEPRSAPSVAYVHMPEPTVPVVTTSQSGMTMTRPPNLRGEMRPDQWTPEQRERFRQLRENNPEQARAIRRLMAEQAAERAAGLGPNNPGSQWEAAVEMGIIEGAVEQDQTTTRPGPAEDDGADS